MKLCYNIEVEHVKYKSVVHIEPKVLEQLADLIVSNKIYELIRRVVEGFDDDFVEILNLYSPLLLSLTAKYSSFKEINSDDREDLYQEAVVALYKAVFSYRVDVENVSFGLYAKICISNRLISVIRMLKSEKNKLDLFSENVNNERNLIAFHSSFDSMDPYNQVIDKERIAQLDVIIETKFSSFEKKVFASYIKGKKSTSIARSLGKSEKSVYNAVCRIKAKIKKCFEW